MLRHFSPCGSQNLNNCYTQLKTGTAHDMPRYQKLQQLNLCQDWLTWLMHERVDNVANKSKHQASAKPNPTHWRKLN